MRLLLVSALLGTFGLLADGVAGVQWTPPDGWTSSGATQMRAATYPVGAGADCVVYFFGATQGGSVQANLDRWQGQFQTPDGKPVAAKIAKSTVHGLPITTIDVSGDYSGMAGPMAKTPTVGKDYRLLGAIVEGPGGNVFVKFSGPAKTVAANQAKFQSLLSSFTKSGN